MFKRGSGAALLASAMLWPHAAQAMTVAQFLQKADSVKARGVLALMSSDAGLLKGEMGQVMTAYRADVATARKVGKQPPSCPPPPGQSDVSGDDVIAWLRAVPEPLKSRTSVKSAFYALMLRHYPCR